MSCRSRLRRLTLAAIVAAIGSGALSVNASAISYVHDSEPSSSGTWGTPFVECPDGQYVLGGGMVSSGSYGSSILSGTGPLGFFPAEAWTADADVWSPVTLSAYAICQGGAVGSDLKYRRVEGTVGAGSRKTLTSYCPKGYRVTGGGVHDSDGFNEVEVKVSRPVDHGAGWQGEMRAFNGNGATVWVNAICASGKFAEHLVYRSKSDTAVNGTQVERIANCPNGARVVGGGVSARNSYAKVNTTSPNGTTGWVSYVDGFGATVTFTTYAVCHT